MTKLSKDTGITWAGLRNALSPNGNPRFATVSKIVAAFTCGVVAVSVKLMHQKLELTQQQRAIHQLAGTIACGTGPGAMVQWRRHDAHAAGV
jgi:hypothetical protein